MNRESVSGGQATLRDQIKENLEMIGELQILSLASDHSRPIAAATQRGFVGERDGGDSHFGSTDATTGIDAFLSLFLHFPDNRPMTHRVSDREYGC